MRAFVTGSYAYGMPHDKSDLDLVVFMTKLDVERLLRVVQWDVGYGEAGKTINVRFDRLNLLICTDEKVYNDWKKGTDRLKKQKPVSRDFACQYMKKIREGKIK